MKVLIFILQKEFRQILRDKMILAMMFIMPTIQLIIMPFAANFEVKNVNLVFVDHDHSSYSEQLIHKISASGYFRLIDAPESYKKGLESIENGKADLILEIPTGFEKNLIREGSQSVYVAVDAINGTKSSLGGAYLNSIISDFNKNLDINVKLAKQNTANPAKIDLENVNWYNPRAEYKYYMVPGILVLLLTLIGGFITALSPIFS